MANVKVKKSKVEMAADLIAANGHPVMTAANLVGPGVQAKFGAARKEMRAGFVERDAEVDLILTAVIAREHVLLVGPPGLGKSMLCNALVAWMHAAKYERLITRFTEPNEIVGPIDIQQLKQGKQVRITAGMLPEADVAFLDEVFKGNSAILNGMLTILNERVCDVGANTRVKCPLWTCLGASNEWPQGEELGALFDRFVFRKTVKPIRTAAGLRRLVTDRNLGPRFTETITRGEIEQAHNEAMTLTWSALAEKTFFDIVTELRSQGIRFFDRRLRKAWPACQAAAYRDGAKQVEAKHLLILQHVLWEEPVESPAKVAEIVARLAHPTGYQVSQAITEAEEVLQKTDRKDLKSVAEATAKLQEIGRNRLASLAGDPEADQARTWLWSEIKTLRLESVEGITGGTF